MWYTGFNPYRGFESLPLRHTHHTACPATSERFFSVQHEQRRIDAVLGGDLQSAFVQIERLLDEIENRGSHDDAPHAPVARRECEHLIFMGILVESVGSLLPLVGQAEETPAWSERDAIPLD